MTLSRSVLAACLALACMTASAAPDTVLMQVGDTVVTEADVQAEILRAPPQARTQAYTSRQTLHLIVRNLMTRRLLAREAQANGLAATDAVREHCAWPKSACWQTPGCNSLAKRASLTPPPLKATPERRMPRNPSASPSLRSRMRAIS